MKWNKKSDVSSYSERYIPNDSLLFLVFESGPLGVLSLIGGGGLINDVQNCGLSPDSIIRQYLLWNQNDKALNLLLSLNWNTSGPTCLAGLYHIANHVFRQTFTPEREILLEAALGSFYSPVRPLTRFSEDEFGNQVHDLTRRFFYHLLRHRLYEKAYCLAIDLGNSDLFVDLYHCAKLLKDEEMALACKAKFEEFSCLSEISSRSCCSHSSCSCSESQSDNEEDYEDAILPPLPQVSVKKSRASKVPPLPDLNRHNKLRGSAFFNCSSTYLQSDSLNSVSKEINPELPDGFEPQTASTSFNEFYPSFLNDKSKYLDFNICNTQILTPDFPHSYEIRTSFSGEEVNTKTFTPIKPIPQKFSDPRTSKNLNLFQPQNGSFNAFENLINNSSTSMPSIKDGYLKKDLLKSCSNPNLNSISPVKLKSNQEQGPIQSYASNNSFNHSYNIPKVNSFENFLSTSLGPMSLYNGDKPGPGINTFNPNSYLPRNFISRPEPYLPSLKNYNSSNLLLQRPLHFVPNTYAKQVTKPINATSAKQKVKFSDTVTQIVVPVILLRLSVNCTCKFSSRQTFFLLSGYLKDLN